MPVEGTTNSPSNSTHGLSDTGSLPNGLLELLTKRDLIYLSRVYAVYADVFAGASVRKSVCRIDILYDGVVYDVLHVQFVPGTDIGRFDLDLLCRSIRHANAPSCLLLHAVLRYQDLLNLVNVTTRKLRGYKQDTRAFSKFRSVFTLVFTLEVLKHYNCSGFPPAHFHSMGIDSVFSSDV